MQIAFAALLVCAAARPSILGPVILGPAPSIVHSIPAAISHQSHVQIHSRPVVVSPLIHPVPLVHGPIVHPGVIAGPVLGPHPLWLH